MGWRLVGNEGSCLVHHPKLHCQNALFAIRAHVRLVWILLWYKTEHRHGNMWKSIANHPSSQKSFLYFVNIRRPRDHHKKYTFDPSAPDHVSILNRKRFNLHQIWEWWTNLMENSDKLNIDECELDKMIFHLTQLS